MTFFRAYPMTPLSCLIQSGRTVPLTGGGGGCLQEFPTHQHPVPTLQEELVTISDREAVISHPSLLTRLVSFCF